MTRSHCSCRPLAHTLVASPLGISRLALVRSHPSVWTKQELAEVRTMQLRMCRRALNPFGPQAAKRYRITSGAQLDGRRESWQRQRSRDGTQLCCQDGGVGQGTLPGSPNETTRASSPPCYRGAMHRTARHCERCSGDPEIQKEVGWATQGWDGQTHVGRTPCNEHATLVQTVSHVGGTSHRIRSVGTLWRRPSSNNSYRRRGTGRAFRCVAG